MRGNKGDRNGTKTVTKGGQAVKEQARALTDLRTREKEIHEKDKANTLMSLMILEIDQ